MEDFLLEVQMNPTLQVSPTMHNLILGYFLLEIHLDNAGRSGELRNLTLEQLKKAKKHPSGALQILSNEHKTQVEYGDTDIVVSPALVPFLKIYLDKVRSLASLSSSSDKVFLTHNGSELQSSYPKRLMQKLWDESKASAHSKSEVGPTLFRKKAVTSFMDQRPEKKNCLAKKMEHDPKTADAHYYLFDKRKNAMEMSDMMRETMKAHEGLPHVEKPSTSDGVAQLSSPVGESREVPADYTGKIVRGYELDEEYFGSSEEDEGSTFEGFSDCDGENPADLEFLPGDQSDNDSINSNRNKNKNCVNNKWSLLEEDQLFESCKDLLHSGKVLSKNLVYGSLRTTRAGKEIWEQFEYRTIHNKLKYIKSRHPRFCKYFKK